jgi:glycosyltransferase involved in cell wall biosynthesis
MSHSILAIVVIGRNEGERLRRCLASALVCGHAATIIYVDSGSTDGSGDLARGMGCEVVDLDLTIPFTAARARNEGFRRALQVSRGLSYVQFVDGDCEIFSGWINTAISYFLQNPTAVAVCGRRRERHPEASLYNQLCDIEWDTPVGRSRSCGGDAMMRADALKDVGGYRADLIAGEEPELCVRLRAKGGNIWRLDHEMTLHDAAMTRFGQWWNRSKRAGYAFAEGAVLHGAYPERHYVRPAVRALVWGFLLPVCIGMAAAWRPAMTWLFLVYPVQIVRIAMLGRLHGSVAWWHAGFQVLAKFPEFHGLMKYWLNRVRSKSGTLIEYK